MASRSKTNYTGSGDNQVRLDTVIIINCVLNAPLLLISITGNLLVLVSILRTPSLRSPSIALLCSLAASDFLVGTIVQPLYIASELLTNSSLKQATDAMAFALCGVSLLTMTTISVDRFLALHYHMRYPNLMTTNRAVYASAALWFITFLLGFLTVRNVKAYQFSVLIIIAICVLVSTVCYLQIYGIVRKHQSQIHVQQQAVGTNTTGNHQIRDNLNVQRSAKSAKNTFMYYIMMILCYTPLFIAMTILFFFPNHWTVAWNLTDTATFMNSSMNPFLYCWRLRELRTAIIKTARKMLCKTETGENLPN